jgi:Family of unknown function (DUF5675)
MDINLVRRWFTANSTIGQLSIPSANFVCFTLEDVVRGPGEKIHGKTAIPLGKYKVTLDPSPKFHQAIRPRLHDVPNFEGILIHEGNTAENTEGCILVGRTRADDKPDFIGSSQDALHALMPILQQAAGDPAGIWISITGAPS